MDDAKRLQREAEETAKETARKMDGTTDLDDQVANLGDDVSKHLGNAGDAAREAVHDVGDNLKESGDDARRGVENVVDDVEDGADELRRDVERGSNRTS